VTQPCVEVAPDPPPLPSRELTAATLMIVLLFVAVAIYEVFAVRTKRRTISQRIQQLLRGHRVWQGLAFVGFVLLGVHLIFGGPL
jgi:type IV secretory pathway VirB2 component (pilin)